MFTFILVMAAGVIIGYMLRRLPNIQKVHSLIHIVTGIIHRIKPTYRQQPQLFLRPGCRNSFTQHFGQPSGVVGGIPYVF